MDNGSWVALFIPFPLMLLFLGVVAVIVLFGVAFLLNQVIGLLIEGMKSRTRERKKDTGEEQMTVRAPTTADASKPSGPA